MMDHYRASRYRQLGRLLHLNGKLLEAEPLLREALEVQRRMLGDEHPNTLKAKENLDKLIEARAKAAAGDDR